MERILLLLILFFLGTYQTLKAQNRKDSMEYEMNRLYRLKTLGLSSSGKWAMVAKYYDRNRDTTVVVNSSAPNKNPLKIIGKNLLKAFLKDEAIIAFGNKKVEYTSLTKRKKIVHANVKHAFALSNAGRYGVLLESDTLIIYDSKANRLYSLKDVKNLPVTGKAGQAFVYRNNKNKFEVLNVSSPTPKIIYNTENEVKRTEISKSGNFLVIVEVAKESSSELLILINIKNGEVFKPVLPSMETDAFLSYTELENGTAWIVSINRKITADKVVDIWYGNDGNLINKDRRFKISSEHLYYNAETGRVTRLPSKEHNTILPTGNKNYLLVFNDGELQNYSSLAQDIHASILDVYKGKTVNLDTIKTATIFMPVKGNNILYLSKKDVWVLVDLKTMLKTEIAEKQLVNPSFSQNGKLIYFESDHGLFLYDIKRKILENTGIGSNLMVQILNRSRSSLAGSYLNINIVEIQDQLPLLLEIKDKEKNAVTYKSYFEGKEKTLVPITTDKIRELYYDRQLKWVWYSSENYNRPATIYCFGEKHSISKEIIAPNENDVSVKQLKLEIIHYKNTDGKHLKGLLYYPSKFEPTKKYPVIVRIYQIQSNTSNEYQLYGYDNPVAFDLRVLVERGYFVFLPDIVFDKRGTGLSALDCVNSALDTVIQRSYIDATKIGLTGHSHGGYETNFIATHSSRFAAYLSGAGNSDLVRSYFSYNENFHSPFYWQYENGQYEMPVAMSKNKELYLKNSPINYVDLVNAPILLWAGKKDENIKWDQSMEFFIGLKRNNKDVIALFYPDQGHSLGLGTDERVDLYYKALDWWDYHLKEKKVSWIDVQMKKGAL